MDKWLLEIEKCTECDACMEVCPTYEVTGDPLASPKGRLASAAKVFEKGFPYQYAENTDNDNDSNINNDNDDKNLNLDLVPDPLVQDDQAIIVNLRKKGSLIVFRFL